MMRLFILDADPNDDNNAPCILSAFLGRLGQMTGIRLAGGASAAPGMLSRYLAALGLPWSPLAAWHAAPGNAGDLIVAGGWRLPLWGHGTVPLIPWQAAPHGSLWAVTAPTPGGVAISVIRHDGRVAWTCRPLARSGAAIADAAAEALTLALAALRDGVEARARWAPAGEDCLIAAGWNSGGGS